MTDPAIARAQNTVLYFTGVAAVTGAIPVPAASVAIVAENATMIATVGAELGARISLEAVVASLGVLGSVNMIGRAVFVEGARGMGWFAGPAGVAGVSALGATTAAVQTWCLGQLAIAIARNGGLALARGAARRVLNDAARTIPSWEDLRAAAHRRPANVGG